MLRYSAIPDLKKFLKYLLSGCLLLITLSGYSELKGPNTTFGQLSENAYNVYNTQGIYCFKLFFSDTDLELEIVPKPPEPLAFTADTKLTEPDTPLITATNHEHPPPEQSTIMIFPIHQTTDTATSLMMSTLKGVISPIFAQLNPGLQTPSPDDSSLISVQTHGPSLLTTDYYLGALLTAQTIAGAQSDQSTDLETFLEVLTNYQASQYQITGSQVTIHFNSTSDNHSVSMTLAANGSSHLDLNIQFNGQTSVLSIERPDNEVKLWEEKHPEKVKNKAAANTFSSTKKTNKHRRNNDEDDEGAGPAATLSGTGGSSSGWLSSLCCWSASQTASSDYTTQYGSITSTRMSRNHLPDLIFISTLLHQKASGW